MASQNQNSIRALEIKFEDILVISGIFFIALIFRTFLMHYRFAVVFDEVNYLKLGVSGALNGFSNILHPYWSPLYPFAVMISSKFIPNYEIAGRLVSIFSGSFLAVVLFFFSGKLFGKKIGYIAASLLAVYPVLAFSDTAIRPEPLYTLLIVLGMFAGWEALMRCSWIYSSLTGLLFGLCYLAKPEGIGFFIVFTIIALVVTIVNIVKYSKYKHLFLIFALIFGFLIVSSPYLIYLKKSTGEWTISIKGKANQLGEAILFQKLDQTGSSIYSRLSDDNTSVLIDKIYHLGNFVGYNQKQEGQVVNVSFKVVLKKYLTNFYRVLKYTIPQVLSSILFALMVIGLFSEAWDKKRLLFNSYLLSFILFFWLVVIPFFHINERYFRPLIPICFIWIATGVQFISVWFFKTVNDSFKVFTDRLSQRLAFILVATFIGIFVIVPELGKILKRQYWSEGEWADPVEQKEAGLWLRDHFNGIPVIMSKFHTADIYAGNYNIKDSVTIPQCKFDRLIKYAKYRSVDFLLLNERYKEFFPEISFLLEGKNIPEELELIYDRTDPLGLRTVIYRILNEDVTGR